MFNSRRGFIGVILAPLVALIPKSAMSADCRAWFGKGYCTDYVKQKTGRSQRGDAKAWKGNTKRHEVKAGDVAIFDFGKWGHVAYIEKVAKDKREKPTSLTVSEMNWGSPLDDCAKSPMFGKVGRRTVSLDKVDRIWRP